MKDKSLPFILSLLFLSVFFVSFASGASSSIVKNGNAFSASSGSYATSTHCVNPVCSWISGNQAIVGVYDANVNNWQGSLRYDFDLSRYTGIQKVVLNVDWPNSVGKGLHSPFTTGRGKIAIGNENGILATYPVTSVRCLPANDYFATPCQQFSVTKTIPLNLIQPNTKVYLIADSGTAWDVGKVKMTITTSSSSSCRRAFTCGGAGTPALDDS